MIECRDLIKIYLDETSNLKVPALRGIDLKVGKGEVISIVGPSGSGKTTLINILAGFETISSGFLRVGEYTLEDLIQTELLYYRLKTIGIVDQFPERTLFLSGTVYDNMVFVYSLQPDDTANMESNIIKILDELGIAHLSNRKVRLLSGGEMIRTAIACALVKRVPLLLCDEPTGQLDSENTEKVKETLRNIARSFGTTVLVVTHDERFLEGVDKTCEIRNGRVSILMGKEEQMIYGGQTKFPIRYKRQLDSSNSVRLPDLVIEKLKIQTDVEFEISEDVDVRVRNPKKVSIEKIVLKELKVRRKKLILKDIPTDYHQDQEIDIKFRNISKIYEKKGENVEALKNINLNIHKGELIFILGPSGSGKTTLIKLISGVELHSFGEIIIKGVNFSNLNDEEKAQFRLETFGIVPQQGNLHPYLTIEENIILKDIIAGEKIRSDQIDLEQNSKLLEDFEIIHRKNSYPLEISGGELQRASLAIANYKSPSILILDEPTANMDAELAEQVMNRIYELHQKYNLTIIIATHDINLLKNGMRIVQLIDGQISKDGLVK